MTAASVTLRPRIYRTHLTRPEYLPTLLRRASQALLGNDCAWDVYEDESGMLIDDTDYVLTHPQQRVLVGMEDWQLSGVVVTALVALLLVEEGGRWH